ncbi:MAG: redoxin domain-containing protein [Cytophagales bacterium]|nr:redoxin domain-containing protein [Cytophagales bacterium]
MKTKSIIFLLIFYMGNLYCLQAQTGSELYDQVKAAKVSAPEINTSFGWVNTNRSWSIKDFRGKIVLLDFWTFGCINCYHILPDLDKLERQFSDDLVIIGVHSGKFTGERTNDRILRAVQKFGIHHPVVNDADYKVWKAYAVHAWPTVVLIAPNGKIVGSHSGEDVYETVLPYIKAVKKVYGNAIDKKPIDFGERKEMQSVLRFPSKILANEDGTFWISDTGHNRLVRIDPEGNVLDVVGDGQAGFRDGGFENARFSEPRGMAWAGKEMYVADTRNNAIRKVDFARKKVVTVSGDGELGRYYFDEDWGKNVRPNSPWDLAAVGSQVYVANAGNHQILRYDTKKQKTFRYAGSGQEGLADGPLKEASFSQPSGLSVDGQKLYVADPEGSAVREIDLETRQVKTLLGKGLFVFGDKNGDFSEALLQHDEGLFFYKGKLYAADTYNGKIKVIDLRKKRIHTLVQGLSEPGGILVQHDIIWIVNTNVNQIVRFDLESKEKRPLKLREPKE